jgi:hypothetical protein
MNKQQDNEKNCKEYYVLLLCQNLVKKLQKYLLSLSHLRHLDKKITNKDTD